MTWMPSFEAAFPPDSCSWSVLGAEERRTAPLLELGFVAVHSVQNVKTDILGGLAVAKNRFLSQPD